ncbi:MAG: hypothetical protein Q4D89_12560 [Arachnia propionica]|nr:hypothetical protein [Arachnia propionica]
MDLKAEINADDDRHSARRAKVWLHRRLALDASSSTESESGSR